MRCICRLGHLLVNATHSLFVWISTFLHPHRYLFEEVSHSQAHILWWRTHPITIGLSVKSAAGPRLGLLMQNDSMAWWSLGQSFSACPSRLVAETCEFLVWWDIFAPNGQNYPVRAPNSRTRGISLGVLCWYSADYYAPQKLLHWFLVRCVVFYPCDNCE